MVLMYADRKVQSTHVIGVEIRVFVRHRKVERLHWVPGHCVAAHFHQQLAQGGGAARVVEHHAAI